MRLFATPSRYRSAPSPADAAGAASFLPGRRPKRLVESRNFAIAVEARYQEPEA